jgi:SAM-dependent methyltransferase
VDRRGGSRRPGRYDRAERRRLLYPAAACCLNWNPENEEKCLNTTEKPLVASVQEVISGAVTLSGRRVADVGCGGGTLVRWLADRAAQVVGIETQEELVEQARRRQPVAGERYLHGRGESMPLDDASMDLVIFSFSLHHVPEASMRRALVEARRVLASGGQLLVVEPVADGGYF